MARIAINPSLETFIASDAAAFSFAAGNAVAFLFADFSGAANAGQVINSATAEARAIRVARYNLSFSLI